MAGLLSVPGGCTLITDLDHADESAPAERALPRRPRIAWVFGSGGPRGFVHVGVIKALDELHLAPDLIVGSSAGALVGTLRAAGLKGREIERLSLDLSPAVLANLAIGARESFNGAPMAVWVHDQVRGRPLDDLPVAMACIAVRQDDGMIVGFTAGHAGVAVQASSAVEGRFTPVRIRGRRFVDPDWHCPLPVRRARALGAVRTLAVDASAHEDRAPRGAEAFAESDRRKRALIRPDAAAADVVLHPDIGYWASVSRTYRERVIEAGYRHAMAHADKLRALHG
ncbi:MAG: patatin-like phospholipase family protein [Burkholderiales bacterium]|nr:patatin-like phospholipase family protein [Burkholderiales bacterium]